MYNGHLETFLCVEKEGSFTKAAEKLNISTTAVMKQMNALESHLGMKLIKRTNSGVELTEAGKCVQKYARKMIRLSAQAIREASEIAERERQVIRVGSSLLNPCRYLMDIWRNVGGAHPEFRLQIIPFEDSADYSVLRRLSVDIDCVVAPNDSVLALDVFKFYPLGSFKICVAAPLSHRLAEKDILTPGDLNGESLIMVRRGNSAVIDKMRDDFTLRNPEIHIIDTDFYYEAETFNRCERENALLLTLESWQGVHPSLVTIPVDWEYEMPYGVLCALEPPRYVLKFLECLNIRNG